MEYVTHIEGGISIRIPLEKDPAARKVSERARRGYYRTIDGVFNDGIDMRGKTSAPTHSYVIDGIVHHLDSEGFSALQKFFGKRRRLTVLAKALIEARDYDALSREYEIPRETFSGISKKSSKDAQLASALAMMA